jgi:mono/diheme cytochrome c family protein
MQVHIALLAALLGVLPVLNGALGWAGDAGSQTPGTVSSSDSKPKPSSGDSSRGEQLYDASCVVCHGPHASGGIGPRLANNPVLSNDQAFWTIVYEGRHVMPPLKGAVTEHQMADIRAWLLTLR